MGCNQPVEDEEVSLEEWNSSHNRRRGGGGDQGERVGNNKDSMKWDDGLILCLLW